VLRFGAII
jgi:hypothetical protein